MRSENYAENSKFQNLKLEAKAGHVLSLPHTSFIENFASFLNVNAFSIPE